MRSLRHAIACAFGIGSGLIVACATNEPPAEVAVEAVEEASPVQPEEPPVLREAFGIALPASARERRVSPEAESFSSDEPLGTVRNHFRQLDIPFSETHYPSGTAFRAQDGSGREVMVHRGGPRGQVSIDVLRQGRESVQALRVPPDEQRAGDDPLAPNQPVVLNAQHGGTARNTGGAGAAEGLAPDEDTATQTPQGVRVVTETSVPQPTEAQQNRRVERRVQGVRVLNRGTTRDPNVDRPLSFPTINYEAPRNPNAYF